jgi:DNA-binding NarL/FixJ family response regulator
MRVLLADDHRMMLEGLRAVLEKAGVEVAGEAATGRDAIREAKRLRPDVVVMDLSMPDLNGVDATRRLVRELPGIRIIALSMSADRRYVTAMLDAGAVGYLLKDEAPDTLLRALDRVSRGLTFFSSGVIAAGGEFVTPRSGTPPGLREARPLSSREREVLQLLAEGKSSKEIAAALEIGLPTVETHRRQIVNKLQLRTIAELTKYAIREGLTSIER